MLAAAPPALAEGCPSFRALSHDDAPRLFTQERTLQGLPNPLVSTGVLQATEQAFTWQVCSPFDIRTEITSTGITQAIEGGPAEPIGPDAVQSAIQSLSISDIFRGDLDGLSAVFEISEDAASGGSDNGWTVSLVPFAGPTAAAIERIEISGCRQVSHVLIRYQDGGRDVVAVSGPAADIPAGPMCPAG